MAKKDTICRTDLIRVARLLTQAEKYISATATKISDKDLARRMRLMINKIEKAMT